ncbi:MAG: ATPase domain [Solirubrobacteraceae bacterium]|nr:ATPase domain [Solirubrobacteraceae bacterium]
MELLGREAETEALAKAVVDVRAGERRTLGVLGEAGIGKSSLLALAGELAADAELQVLVGRAAEHERAVPFALVIDALDDVVGGETPPDLRPAPARPPARPERAAT